MRYLQLQNPVVAASDNPILSSKYFEVIKSPQGVMLAVCLLIFLILNIFSGDKKGKLASGRWATSKEINAAKKKALKQMSKKSRNSVALYIGSSKKRSSK